MVKRLGKFGEFMIKDSVNQSFWNKKNVLVTGHTGFKGTWLSLWLNLLGAKVTGISLDPEESSLFNKVSLKEVINHKTIDITNYDSLSKTLKEINPEIVFHLAAQSLVIESYKNPRKTWMVNTMGSVNVIEAIRELNKPCILVMITTDKVYKNFEWEYSYREIDELGGNDPYSSSKAAAEIAIQSLRKSFFDESLNQENYLKISSARSGNVIGGGDWAENRIVPDAIRALKADQILSVRNPFSTRPWLHVLEPLNGYLLLAQSMMNNDNEYNEAFNFAPSNDSNRTVEDLINEIFKHWKGRLNFQKDFNNFKESRLLSLSSDKAKIKLNWQNKWNFEKTVEKTVMWYKNVEEEKISPLSCCYSDLDEFMHET